MHRYHEIPSAYMILMHRCRYPSLYDFHAQVHLCTLACMTVSAQLNLYTRGNDKHAPEYNRYAWWYLREIHYITSSYTVYIYMRFFFREEKSSYKADLCMGTLQNVVCILYKAMFFIKCHLIISTPFSRDVMPPTPAISMF